MSDEYEEYLKACEIIEKDNEEYIDIFENDLEDSGLSYNTIDKHSRNIRFYLNTFLLKYDAVPMKEGVRHVDEFLGEFFIRKCMWSTPATIKGYAASLKKFYKSMLNHEKIEKIDYEILCSEIKNNIDNWTRTCAIFNDPDQDNPFFFF